MIPIKTPRRPRVTLPVMACCMFLFAPCFAAALMAHARPYVFLAMALTMHTYSGWVHAYTSFVCKACTCLKLCGSVPKHVLSQAAYLYTLTKARLCTFLLPPSGLL